MILEKVYDELYGMIEDLKKKVAAISGGSVVTITPTLQSGEKLADYSIDGTEGSIYSPAQVNADWNASSGVAQLLNKPDLQPSYTSTGIEVPKGSIVDGGYACIGTMVIVNIRITLTEAVAQFGTVLTGLPIPQGMQEVSVVVTNRTSPLVINSSGSIVTGESITTGTLLLNAIYLRTLPTRTNKKK